MPEFDLVDEPWLRLRPRSGGNLESRGLLETLLEAHAFEALVVELPTQLPALLRQVLLPVVLDALGAPANRREWGRRFAAGGFSAEEKDRLREYLEKYRSRFDLFDAEQPFAQVASLRTAKDETKGSALMVATAATGNNVPLFAARTDADPLWLSPAEAARWLLHVQCWDTAAIKTGAVGDPQAKGGKTTGNPTGPLGQLGVLAPTGRTLYETIMLNLPIGKQDALGTPQWQREPLGPVWRPRPADGLLDLLTWQARRVRLIPEDTPEGARVTRLVLTAGDRLQPLPEWEPHTAWQRVKDTKSPTGTRRRPRRHTPGTFAWRGLEALLASTRDNDSGAKGSETSSLLIELANLQEDGMLAEEYPLQLETFGIAYGNQSAVIDDLVHDTIPLPIAALRADEDIYALLVEVSQQSEALAQAVNYLSADLRRASGTEPIPWDQGQRPGQRVLQALDPRVRRLLAGVQQAAGAPDVLEHGRLAWEQVARQQTRSVADSLLAATPTASTFLGRTIEHEKTGKTSVYSLGTAENNFARRLAGILPRAAAHARETLTASCGEASHDQDITEGAGS